MSAMQGKQNGSAASRLLRAARGDLAAGALVTVIVLAGGAAWSMTTRLSGAVIAPGVVVVESQVKVIQHPTGGVVAEIAVRNGQPVAEGDPLVRLDDTLARANLGIIVQQLDELEARAARLRAESFGRGDYAPSTAQAERIAAHEAVAAIWQGEAALFDVRRGAREGQKALLAEQIGQLREQVKGLTLQAQAKAEEIRLVNDEMKGVEVLFAKGLAPKTRVTEIRREAVRIGGEHGQLIATIAASEGRRTELQAQMLQVDQEFRSEAAEELREAEAKIAELQERRVAAEDQLRRVELRSPVAGVVHELALHTIGGVVTTAEPLMKIVPAHESFFVAAQVAPTDIDQIALEQHAMLRFSAFNQQITPEIPGVVSQVSADVTTEERTDRSFYRVEIAPDSNGAAIVDKLKLISGMPVEVHIATHERTPLSYLTKPLADQLQRAFRED